MAGIVGGERRTATGIAGPIGASFGIVEVDWKCSGCSSKNRASRYRCHRCKTPRIYNSDQTENDGSGAMAGEVGGAVFGRWAPCANELATNGGCY